MGWFSGAMWLRKDLSPPRKTTQSCCYATEGKNYRRSFGREKFFRPGVGGKEQLQGEMSLLGDVSDEG